MIRDKKVIVYLEKAIELAIVEKREKLIDSGFSLYASVYKSLVEHIESRLENILATEQLKNQMALSFTDGNDML